MRSCEGGQYSAVTGFYACAWSGVTRRPNSFFLFILFSSYPAMKLFDAHKQLIKATALCRLIYTLVSFSSTFFSVFWIFVSRFFFCCFVVVDSVVIRNPDTDDNRMCLRFEECFCEPKKKSPLTRLLGLRQAEMEILFTDCDEHCRKSMNSIQFSVWSPVPKIDTTKLL